jgi:YesN/AraC family two-component response regulator
MNFIAILKLLSRTQERNFEDNVGLEICKSISMSEETKNKIIKGLEYFEKQQLYKEKGITQAKLAVQLQTNTKYLSVIIKNYKAENFNLYISMLRVNYIVEKLENNMEYRKYKISYLASETGFATSSSFTRTFRKIIGITPSAYINLQNIQVVN